MGRHCSGCHQQGGTTRLLIGLVEATNGTYHCHNLTDVAVVAELENTEEEPQSISVDRGTLVKSAHEAPRAWTTCVVFPPVKCSHKGEASMTRLPAG